VVEIQLDILREVDGPVLKYGLQDMQGQRIAVPHADRLRPRREFLEERYTPFKEAA
jgi:putative restriction endonuclease